MEGITSKINSWKFSKEVAPIFNSSTTWKEDGSDGAGREVFCFLDPLYYLMAFQTFDNMYASSE